MWSNLQGEVDHRLLSLKCARLRAGNSNSSLSASDLRSALSANPLSCNSLVFVSKLILIPSSQHLQPRNGPQRNFSSRKLSLCDSARFVFHRYKAASLRHVWTPLFAISDSVLLTVIGPSRQFSIPSMEVDDATPPTLVDQVFFLYEVSNYVGYSGHSSK